ncbi:MAG: polyprenol monophosphomannose synthase [Flavobacteriaceae bacterium]|jgi:dolichol-phosphate mannosyltransferase|nr:polyprenol monophosphomannose synthase [Flavobacteriaceae bacterium]
MQDAIVIIPTYNEIENIEGILAAVFSEHKAVHVLVVDDSSPDNTAQKVEELYSTYKDRLFLLKRTGKQGLGTAYIEGFKWCLSRSYEYIFEMDADFSHNPKDLHRLYETCKFQNADIAVGSRYIKGVNVVNWPLTRVLLSYGASLYVRIITGMKVLDPTAGFVCYKRKVLESINLEAIKFIGYAFQIEMKYSAYKKNFNIKEIPIIFTDRRHGVSKLSKGIISEAILGVIKMRLKTILGTT